MKFLNSQTINTVCFAALHIFSLAAADQEYYKASLPLSIERGLPVGARAFHSHSYQRHVD